MKVRVLVPLTVVLDPDIPSDRARNPYTYLMHAIACMALDGVHIFGGNAHHPLEADPVLTPGNTAPGELHPGVCWTNLDTASLYVDIDTGDTPTDQFARVIDSTLAGIAEECMVRMPSMVKALTFGEVELTTLAPAKEA